jgi:hypothetical protein
MAELLLLGPKQREGLRECLDVRSLREVLLVGGKERAAVLIWYVRCWPCVEMRETSGTVHLQMECFREVL